MLEFCQSEDREGGVFFEMKIWLDGWSSGWQTSNQDNGIRRFHGSEGRKDSRFFAGFSPFPLRRSLDRHRRLRNRKGKMRVGTNLSFGIAMDVVVVRRYVRSLAHCTVHGKSRFIGLERCLAQFRKWLSLSRVETNTLGVIHPFSVPSDDDRTN